MSSIETPSRVRLRSAEIGEPIPRIHGGRVLLINAAPSQDRLQAQLHSLGYNVVGRSADPWEGLSLVGSLRPDAILIVADSFDVRTAVLLARRIREHHRMAVLLLCADPNPRSLAQLKTARSHDIVVLPAADSELDAAIQSALHAVFAQPRVVSLARPPRDASPNAKAAFDEAQLVERFKITSARAARTGSRFAVGVVEIRCSRTKANEERQLDVKANASERLKRLLRQTDAVAMEADGNLAFLVEDVDAATVDAVGGRITRVLSEPMRAGNDACMPLPMVGIAVWQSPDDDAQRLLATARQALRDKVRDGGKGWRVAPSAGEDHETQPRRAPRPSRVKPSVVLQRTVGWLSLITIGWVVANYSEIMRSKNLLVAPQQLIDQFQLFVSQVQHLMTSLSRLS